jgi:hypothetical protein
MKQLKALLPVVALAALVIACVDDAGAQQPPAWRAVRNTYDPALARRALQDQGQQELSPSSSGLARFK